MPSDRAGLHVSAITVTVGSRGEAQRIVDIDALAIEPGARIGLAGPSGSGKTSLLHVFAGLLRPEAGKVVWNGTDIATLGEVARDAWRRANVGMVFQDFLLVPELSALENVLLPCSFGGAPAGDHRAAAIALLAETGIITPARNVAALSRGEQQRVAIARALLFAPKLILADEPTASLDAATAGSITDLLVQRATAGGAMLVVVSHDQTLLAQMDKVYQLDRGKLR